MGIRIYNPSVTLGVNTPLSIYTDTFARANQTFISQAADGTTIAPFPWGVWFTSASLYTPGNNPIVNALYQGLNIFNNELVLQSAGGANDLSRFACFLTPAIYWGQPISQQSQFSQYTLSGDTSDATHVMLAGPVVFASNNFAGNCYLLQANTISGQLILFRGISSLLTQTQLIAGGGPMICAVGDVLRLECVRSTTGNTLTCYRNGVVVGTITDSNAARPLWGYPGIGLVTTPGNAYRQSIQNYSGGPL